MWMVNALLGVGIGDAARHAGREEQLAAAGAALDDLARQVEFIRRQVLRACRDGVQELPVVADSSQGRLLSCRPSTVV